MSTPENVAFDNVRRIAGHLTQRQLHKLKRIINRELTARYQATEALKERMAGGLQGMANVMAGVTWALACRQALRESKGHEPVGGKRPASGEMWLPRELLYAVRHQVKARGWHPITALNWDVVRANLAAEARAASRPPVSESIHAELDGSRMSVAKFVVPMVKGEVNRIIDLDYDRAFDFGGEA